MTASADWSTSPPAGGNYQWTSCTIAANVTLTVPSGMTMRCNGAFTLGANSQIIVKSWINSTGLAIGVMLPGYAQIPTAFGVDTAGVPLATAYNITATPQLGGGSGIGSSTSVGGIGGGTFGIRAKGGITLTSTSSIRANGTSALAGSTTGGGGGAGGIVVLVWGTGTTLSASGALVQATGGNGASGSNRGGGGGGGGIVRLIGPGATTSSVPTSLGGGTVGVGTSITSSGNGAGGACGGLGGSGSYGNGTAYVPANPGGTGYVAATNVSDASNLFF